MTFSEKNLSSLLPLDTEILISRIHFKLEITDIYNQYYLYSRTCTYVSSILEVVYFTVSCEPVACIRSLCIIISIAYAEVLIVFVLDISNAFQNTILPNLAEIFVAHCFQRHIKRSYS